MIIVIQQWVHSNLALNVPFLYVYYLFTLTKGCYSFAINKPATYNKCRSTCIMAVLGVHQAQPATQIIDSFGLFQRMIDISTPAPLPSTMMWCHVPTSSLFESYNKMEAVASRCPSPTYVCFLLSLVESGPHLQFGEHLAFFTGNQNGSQDALPSSTFFHHLLLLHGHDQPKVWHKEGSLQVQDLCSWQQFFIKPLLNCCDRQKGITIKKGMCSGLILF